MKHAINRNEVMQKQRRAVNDILSSPIDRPFYSENSIKELSEYHYGERRLREKIYRLVDERE